MRLCLTGAAGNLGRIFLRLAARQPGLRIRALARPGAVPSGFPGVDWVEGDLSDPLCCHRLVQDADVFVHMAWRGVPLATTDYAAGLSAGLLPTLGLLDVARQRPGLHIVFPSSGGTVYADRGEHRPHREDDLCLPISPYAIQKLAAEHYLQVLCASGKASARILRVSTAYGWLATEGAQQGFVGIALAAALSGQPVRIIGDPDNVRDFVHGEDVARALLAAATRPMEAGRAEVINVGSGVGTSVRDVVAMIERQLGRRVATRQEHWEVARGLPQHSVLDVGRAAELLGWSPRIPLEDGIAMVLRGRARAAA
jgi:UDP-glucose 4-epimerase